MSALVPGVGITSTNRCCDGSSISSTSILNFHRSSVTSFPLESKAGSSSSSSIYCTSLVGTSQNYQDCSGKIFDDTPDAFTNQIENNEEEKETTATTIAQNQTSSRCGGGCCCLNKRINPTKIQRVITTKNVNVINLVSSSPLPTVSLSNSKLPIQTGCLSPTHHLLLLLNAMPSEIFNSQKYEAGAAAVVHHHGTSGKLQLIPPPPTTTTNQLPNVIITKGCQSWWLNWLGLNGSNLRNRSPVCFNLSSLVVTTLFLWSLFLSLFEWSSRRTSPPLSSPSPFVLYPSSSNCFSISVARLATAITFRQCFSIVLVSSAATTVPPLLSALVLFFSPSFFTFAWVTCVAAATAGISITSISRSFKKDFEKENKNRKETKSDIDARVQIRLATKSHNMAHNRLERFSAAGNIHRRSDTTATTAAAATTTASFSSFSVCAVLLILLLSSVTRVAVAQSAATPLTTAASSSNLAASSAATSARVANPNRINIGGNLPSSNNILGPGPVHLHRQNPTIPTVSSNVNRANSNSSPTTSRTTSSSQFSSRLPPQGQSWSTVPTARSPQARQSRPSRPSQLRSLSAVPGLSTISIPSPPPPSSTKPSTTTKAIPNTTTTTTTTTTTSSTTTTTNTTPGPTRVLYEDEYDNDYVVESLDDPYNQHSHNHPSSNVSIFANSPNVFAYSSNSESLARPYRDMYFKEEMQRYDGWYNNLAHPGWGSTESHLTRKAPPSYADGVYMMAGEDRPSPRELSQALMKGEDGKGSARNLTVLFAFFGQMVSSEILMASEPGCPIEMHRIKIAKCDEMYDRDCRGGRTMPFHRAIYDTRTGQSPNNPREQLNMVTSWIDGSFIYSTSETWLNSMRNFENGTFKTDETGGFPPRNRERVPLINSPPAHHLKMTAPDRMFLLGDSRTNQNPVILAFGIVMFRWHNILARRVQSEHPDWSDEDIFQRSRRLVIASLQNIILYEYLETLFDEPTPAYSGYKPDVHPGVSHVFQSAAFRFGHTMIPPGLYRRDARCNFLKTAGGHSGIRLCSTWWDAVDVLPNAGLEELLMGLSSQIAEREDSVLCSDVRDKLFGPLDFSRRDLAALNIMRGRDNGIPDYNTIRKYFKLPPISNWSQINPKLYERSPKLFETLAKLYDNNLENIDVYVGGMVESELETGRPGPLFRAIIKEQFLRIRDSDRFWFENEHNGLFSKEEINEIRKIKLWDIIVNATAVPADAIQRDVFLFRPNDPCPQPRQMTSKVLESCVILAGWNYFHGSELPYIMVILLLVFIPMLVAVMGYAVIKMNNRRRRKIKQQRDVDNKKNYDKLYVREWLHQNHKRYVKAKIGPDQSISTVNRKGETLRKIMLDDTSSLMVEVTQDSNKPMILIRPLRDHDLVLQFDNNGSRKKYLSKLESFLLNHKKTLEIIHTYRDVMLANAETKEKRQKRLEHFFREAYALTFGLKPGEKRKFEDVSNDVIMVMRTSLSRKEFAEALGMKSESLFVKQMFNCCDKDNDGRISFQEFLDTVVLFSRGKTDNKLRIIFDMCDHDADGVIDKMDLTKMLRSLVDIAKLNSMTEDEVMELIEGMFASAGLEDKEELTYDDFKHMMSEYRGDLIAIGLDCKGAKQNFLDTSTNIARMTSFQINSFEPEPNFIIRRWNHFITYLEENRQPIVYLLIFFVASIVLFLERFITYSYLSEHTDLRHVMGYGIAITRGSAASLSFCYSLLLLTMCRNLITKIREIPLHQYIPLDSHVQFHKIVAITGLIFTIIHTIGHCINFYHVSTQPVEHLRCLTKELQFESDAKPTFSFWIFGTVTGITGILLVLVVAIIFIFAHPRIRQKAYSYFWTTHSLYSVLYLLMFIHGLAKITGTPRFWVFFIGPAIVFILDKIVSLQTKYMELEVLDTELLPSDVTKVKFSRPPNFKYLSGQWVRLCCTAFRSSEYHSLTLTSAPHENYLSVHVKAQGPWTWKLRNYFDPNNFVNIPVDSPLPKIRLEGPFGGGNQDWYKYEVAVMVGGGIGVTPYASILNDLVFGTSTNRYSGVACKKVYFLWICPSHRHFEWFIDVLRDVERKDVTQVLEVHIFITQFFHKFDLRTTMLYICENHFQRISNRSMFTGLKAINHFGRPDMNAFLKFVQTQHSYVSKVGVFSCGPSALTKSVSKACETTNNRRKLPYFIHQFENFG